MYFRAVKLYKYTSRETKWLAGLSLSKRAREVEANKKLAQGIRQFEKAMIVTS